MNRLPLTLLVVTFALAPSVTHAATAIWIGPENGSWSDPANWSTGAVPTHSDVVIIDNDPDKASSTSVGGGRSVASLQVQDGDFLTISSSTFQTRNFELGGRVNVVPQSVLYTNGVMQVASTGELKLESSARIESNLTIPSYWWNQGVIHGAGTMRQRGPFLNQGSIVADTPSRTLEINQVISTEISQITNEGLLRAIDGGHLYLKSTSPTFIVYQPTANARIEAAPQSSVTLERVLVEGGTIAALSDDSGTGTISLLDGGLRNVHLSGQITGRSIYLAGNIHNSGTLSSSSGFTIAAEVVELSGGGIFQLGLPLGGASVPSVGFLSSQPPGFAALRNLDNSIRGHGTLSLLNGTLDNRASIEVGFGEDESTSPIEWTLSLERGKVLNTGTIRATKGNILKLNQAQVINAQATTSGTIEALPGGSVEIVGGSITGGMLRAHTAEAGSTIPSASVTLASRAALSNLKMEGEIGSLNSEASLSGRIEIDGLLRLQRLYMDSSIEFVGGEVHLGESTGSIGLSNGASTNTIHKLTLVDATLRLHTVGGGSSSILLENHGEIIASTGKTANLGYSVSNAGLIHAEPNSTLNFNSIVSSGPNGVAEVRVDSNATVSTFRLSGGKVVSAMGAGTEPFSGTVSVRGLGAGGPAALENVHNLGHIALGSASMGGTIRNDGVVSFGAYTVQQFGALLQLSGGGELRLNGQTLQLPNLFQQPTLMNGTGHTVRTHGLINCASSTIINQGIIQADTGTLVVQTSGSNPGYLRQQGILRTVGSNRLNLTLSQPSLENDGEFDISPSGLLAITGVQQIENRVGSSILASGMLTIERANLVNHSGASIGGGGRIEGTGTTASNQSILTNQGLVAPGTTIGDLEIRGNYIQSATGILEIDVTGFAAGEFDQLKIEQIRSTSGGFASLAGTLEFNFAPELIPALGDELVVLTAKQITGVFDTVEGLPTLAAGLDWQIDYLPTMVMATVIGLTPPNLAGDFNGDGFVNLADYTVWRDGLGDTYAASDYDLWKQNFGRSANDPAPEATAPAAVPEPTTALLAILACAPLFARRALFPCSHAPRGNACPAAPRP